MQCEQVKANGEQCKAHAMADSEFCRLHNPDVADAVKAGQRKGGTVGKAKTLPADTPERPIRTPHDVEQLLSDTINHTLRGTLDVKTANAVGYLAGMVLKAQEHGSLADEIAALKILIEEKGL